MVKDIIVISGQSGAGKGTLIGEILKNHPDAFYYVKSTTTRAPRNTMKEVAQDKTRYQFISREEFERKIKKDEMLEWAEVHGNYYGKAKSEFENAFVAGKKAMVEIDVNGMRAVKKVFGDRVMTIFIKAPSTQELEKRLRLRGSETEEQIKTRLETAKKEEAYVPEYDFSVVNDKIPETVTELEKIINL